MKKWDIRTNSYYVYLVFCLLTLCISSCDISERTSVYTTVVTFDYDDTTKEIVIHSNTAMNELNSRDLFCSGSEPLCRTIVNEELALKICHKYIEDKDKAYYAFGQSEDEMVEGLDHSVDLRLADEMKKHNGVVSTYVDEMKVEYTKDYTRRSYGFIIELDCNRIVTYNYMVLRGKEYLELEFTYEDDLQSDNKKREEVEFIIDAIEGIL